MIVSTTRVWNAQSPMQMKNPAVRLFVARKPPITGPISPAADVQTCVVACRLLERVGRLPKASDQAAA